MLQLYQTCRMTLGRQVFNSLRTSSEIKWGIAGLLSSRTSVCQMSSYVLQSANSRLPSPPLLHKHFITPPVRRISLQHARNTPKHEAGELIFYEKFTLRVRRYHIMFCVGTLMICGIIGFKLTSSAPELPQALLDIKSSEFQSLVLLLGAFAILGVVTFVARAYMVRIYYNTEKRVFTAIPYTLFGNTSLTFTASDVAPGRIGQLYKIKGKTYILSDDQFLSMRGYHLMQSDSQPGIKR